MGNKRINDAIRGRVVVDTPAGKGVRKGPEGVKPEDVEAKNLEELDEAQLVAELADATGKVASAVEAVQAVAGELSARLEGEEGEGEEAPRAS